MVVDQITLNLNDSPDYSDQRVAILDSSYLVHLNLNYLWAVVARDFILSRNLTVIVPQPILKEYEGLRMASRTDSAGLPLAPTSVEELLGQTKDYVREVDQSIFTDSIMSYNLHSNKATLERLDPGFCDLSLLTTALSFADNSREVYVASADRDIFQTLNGLLTKYNNLRILSPSKSLEVNLAHLIKKVNPDRLDFVISEDVFVGLNESIGKQGRYVVVSKDQPISHNVKVDFAFDVVEKPFGRKYDLPQSIYLIPVVNISDKIEKSARYGDKSFGGGFNYFIVMTPHTNSWRIGKMEFVYSGGSVQSRLNWQHFARLDPWQLFPDGLAYFNKVSSSLPKSL